MCLGKMIKENELRIYTVGKGLVQNKGFSTIIDFNQNETGWAEKYLNDN